MTGKSSLNTTSVTKIATFNNRWQKLRRCVQFAWDRLPTSFRISLSLAMLVQRGKWLLTTSHEQDTNRVKIGFVYDAVYPWSKGGGEKTLYELACSLRDRGHDCHLFGMHVWEGPANITRDGLHYHAICKNLPLYGPTGRRTILQPLKLAWGLLNNLRRYQPETFDLFDVHAFPFLSVPAFQLARLSRFHHVPWLLTWLEVWGRSYWRRYMGVRGNLGALVERWCAKTAPHHLCISPTTGRRLRELLDGRESSVTVIPRGFRSPEPDAFARHAKPRNPHKVVIAGRLIDYKHVDVAIRAWPAVRLSVPAAQLHVIGDGPDAEMLMMLTKALGVHGEAGGVFFLGQLGDRAEVLAEIASAALVLQPSEREGQSTVVLEALTLGTPVLAATGPETAVGDFLGSGPLAYMARLEATAGPVEWAERIVALLLDEDSRTALAAIGTREVASLGWDQDIAPRVERLYASLLTKSGRR